MSRLPSPTRRRLLTAPGVTLASVMLVAATVVAAPLALLTDLVSRRRLRWTRLWFLLVGVALVETVAMFGAGLLWLWYAPGGRLRSPASLDAHRRLQLWWVRGLLAVPRWTIAMHLEVIGRESLERGRAVVLARHASHLDAVVPAWLFGHLGGLHLRYVLKDDLQWLPALDTVGNRLPDVFVDRSPTAGSDDLARLHRLARGMDESSVCVIFPEGTFFTPERRDRAAARLARTRPDLEPLARGLRHILPPRPAGTLALLDGAPDADVVIVGHVGLEGFGSLSEIRDAVPLTAPVTIRVWRHRRDELPDDPDDIVTWIVRRWVELDEWIDEELRRRRSPTRAHR